MNKELLTKPFKKEQIKNREGRQGMIYYYITISDVIDRINQACDSVQIIVKEKEIYESEVIVLITLNLDGETKESFGSSMINGSIGDALKSAHSDALKKAAWLFGVPCIFNTTTEPEIDNGQGDVGFRCSVCNRTITKQVYNYSINNYGRPLCIQHQRRFTEDDMVV